MDKVVTSAAEAVAEIHDGASLAAGGFGLCGIPAILIQALLEQGAAELSVVSNNCGVDGWGLAERLRAGGCGIPAFFTPAGVGTQVAEGGLPWRYDADGDVAVASPRKEVREYDGAQYVLEESITTDFALVRAAKGDRHGNLVFDKSARNFNPLAAMAGRVTIAEVEELVDPGELAPDAIHLPGVFVRSVLALTASEAADKRIEKTTVRTPHIVTAGGAN
ncbi:CoA transferase subunit A [Streptomyces sp. NPDC001520]|uniref:CoA transferase subunit A n=1 Tax=Streptomyces sp. NPDC001520 TaxID=3364581 RepID=UPI0036C221B2